MYIASLVQMTDSTGKVMQFENIFSMMEGEDRILYMHSISDIHVHVPIHTCIHVLSLPLTMPAAISLAMDIRKYQGNSLSVFLMILRNVPPSAYSVMSTSTLPSL